jgi:hypothetical protein
LDTSVAWARIFFDEAYNIKYSCNAEETGVKCSTGILSHPPIFGGQCREAGVRLSTSKPVVFSHKTKAAAAADEIRKRILSGRYSPGYQLRQDELSSEFNMSRIPIREALLLLEAQLIHPQ